MVQFYNIILSAEKYRKSKIMWNGIHNYSFMNNLSKIRLDHNSKCKLFVSRHIKLRKSNRVPLVCC